MSQSSYECDRDVFNTILSTLVIFVSNSTSCMSELYTLKVQGYNQTILHNLLLFLIGTVLQVNITTDPPTPPYPAATWIRFRCDILTSLPVSYNWTAYCTSQDSNRVVFRHANLNNTNDIILSVWSTPKICIDTVVCSAVDSMGNSGEASQWIANVTGKN